MCMHQSCVDSNGIAQCFSKRPGTIKGHSLPHAVPLRACTGTQELPKTLHIHWHGFLRLILGVSRAPEAEAFENHWHSLVVWRGGKREEMCKGGR